MANQKVRNNIIIDYALNRANMADYEISIDEVVWQAIQVMRERGISLDDVIE